MTLLDKNGWVYLLHAQGTNRYKIGRTANPIRRYQELKKQSPYPLTILQSFQTMNMVLDEKYLHELFNKYKAHGEWFETDIDVMTLRQRFYSKTHLNIILNQKNQIETLGVNPRNPFWIYTLTDCQIIIIVRSSYQEYYILLENLYQTINLFIETNGEQSIDLTSFAIGWLKSYATKYMDCHQNTAIEPIW